MLSHHPRRRGGRIAKRYVKHVDARHLHQQLGREVLRGAVSNARECNLSRAGLGQFNQFLDILGGKIRPSSDHEASGRDLAHGIEGFERLVGQAFGHHADDDVGVVDEIEL